MPDKIAFVIHGLQVGGAEKFFVDLVNGFHQAGYRPLVIVFDQSSPLVKDLHQDIPLVPLPRKYKYDLSVSWKLKKIIIHHEITKVFCVEGFSFFLAKYPFFGNTKIIFYLSLHSTLPISKKRYLLDLFYLRFVQRQDKVIFICEYQRQLFKSKYYFSASHSCVIYNGINITHYSKNQTRAEWEIDDLNWRESLGIPKNDKVVIMIGRISVEKRHIDAIHALEVFHRKYNRKIHLVIVGDGSAALLKDMKDALTKMKLDNYIHLIGAKKDVRPYLNSADIFTLTSFSETFSIAALEALSMQLPCSLTNVGGAAEMLAEGKLGNLSDPWNPQSIASSWKSLLENMPDPQVIRAYVENHYSREKMIASYIGYLSAN